ncbi:extracellular solute-binding protein [Thioclava kandeliae]|uniref:Putrescine-binding periplasmic protein n=1 Tax=Thioclava kandeliae TaxID=3070818 RepID=A0ABV1SMS1_9RHOB
MEKISRRHALGLLGATALSAPFITPARASSGSVNVYNWADYIGETTLADFESSTGITVNYDNFSSVEEMQAKMLAGSSGYDVVLQSGPQLPVMLEAGIYQPLDKTKLSGWSNLDPKILEILSTWDPGNVYAMPYMWGSVGFAYNAEMLKKVLPDADLDSLDVLLRPENAAALARCGVSILDTPSDVFLMVMKYIGANFDNPTPADFEAAAKAIAPVRSSIRTFSNTITQQSLPAGELCFSNTWSGNYGVAVARSKEAGIKLDLRYMVPETGAPIWIDCWCLPKGAPNILNAHAFVNYMLQPEVIAACTNLTTYANANAKALPFVKKEIANNPALYPDEMTTSRLFAPTAWTTEQISQMNDVWQQIKFD